MLNRTTETRINFKIILSEETLSNVLRQGLVLLIYLGHQMSSCYAWATSHHLVSSNHSVSYHSRLISHSWHLIDPHSNLIDHPCHHLVCAHSHCISNKLVSVSLIWKHICHHVFHALILYRIDIVYIYESPF